MSILNLKAIIGAGIGLGVGFALGTSYKYGKDGYSRDGYDRNGFNRDGYDRSGYDRCGYGRDGYNRFGFDAFGFDRDGRDYAGFDRCGRDSEGFDRNGCDGQGYRRDGYGVDGFNRDGFDRQGYDHDYYNIAGVDRVGRDRNYYAEHIGELRTRLDRAYEQLQQGAFGYAIYDARIVMEDILRALVQHAEGPDESDDRMLINLKICENNHILDDQEFLGRLHGVRKICNTNGHEFGASENMSHNKVHFVIMQIRDLLDSAELKLVSPRSDCMEVY